MGTKMIATLENITPRQVSQGMLGLLILPLTILIGLALLLVLSVRLIISALAQTFRKDLDGFVTGMSAAFSCWPDFNLVYCIFIDGIITTEDGRSLFKKNILSKRDLNGAQKYRKLKETWTYFCGYTFWRKDKNFKLGNHVRDYDYTGKLKISSHSTEEDVRGVVSGLLELPWIEGRSPWEAFVISVSEDAGKPRTLFLLRHHHALFDGYSFTNFMKNLAETDFKLAIPKTFTRRRIKPEGLLRIPYDLAGAVIDNWDFQHDWHFPKNGATREFHTSAYTSVPVELIKEAKRKLGMPYVAVLFSAAGGAIQRMFREAQLPIPEHLTTLVPIPRPNHPGGLVNHMSICTFKWPIKSESTAERAQRIQAQFAHLANSLTTGLLFLVPEIIGLLPTFAQSIFANLSVSGGSVLASCFPVPEEQCFYDGKVASSLYAEFGMPGNTIGTSILMAGINGKQGIALTMDKRIFPSEKIFQHFGEYVEQELKSLL